MRIPKEEYNKAVECLKRYDHNCINIINRQSDILSLSVATNDGMPKAPYSIGDTVFNKVLKLESDEDLQKSIKEYKAVVQALALVNNDSKYIFEELYRKGRTKWQIINFGMSERTFVRRKGDIICAVAKELKKLA
jgi:hypothetical protein